MPAPPPAPQAQTIKQAKAAYKARGQPTISESERRQLQRAAELDRRAERAKEAEKKKAEAAKKRLEREREAQEVVRLATQVRCDKFGHKSSQMHLGAFLVKPGSVKEPKQKENLEESLPGLREEDDFGDSDMDDATLLDALDGTSSIQSQGFPGNDTNRRDTLISAIPPPMLQKSAAQLPESGADDFGSFFDDFGSSTQIARELSADEAVESAVMPQPVITETQRSADEFGDFDLTVEDLEDIGRPRSDIKHTSEDRKLMPPPPLPLIRTKPPVSLDVGFTISELEQYVDDDLQLTQCDPG